MKTGIDRSEGLDGRRRSAPGDAQRAAKRTETAASVIYRALRREIASLRRKPGEAISEKEIAQAFGVSRTPVREALLRLADDGLVEIFPQSGTIVSRIPLESLPESIVIRKAREEAATRYAAERATPRQVDRLRANLDVQLEMQAADDRDGFHAADEDFHRLIAETAGYPGFWTLAQQLKVQLDRYRLLTLPTPGRIGRVIAEHQDILDAIAAHDPAEAVRGMGRHMDALRAYIADVREENPFYFTGSELEDP